MRYTARIAGGAVIARSSALAFIAGAIQHSPERTFWVHATDQPDARSTLWHHDVEWHHGEIVVNDGFPATVTEPYVIEIINDNENSRTLAEQLSRILNGEPT